MRPGLGRIFEENINLFLLLNVPFVALGNLLMFRRRPIRYAEHLILAAYTSGTRSLFFSMVCMPILWLFPEAFAPVTGVYFVCWWGYYAWANRQFLSREGKPAWWRCLLPPILSQVMLTVLVVGVVLALHAMGWVRVK